ncbi:MAG: ferredoxin family protein [Candidatus Bathyarchaeota archaeon]|nr:ferredoxin family protein [Candidatus Bathyarchaeota archaeon]
MLLKVTRTEVAMPTKLWRKPLDAEKIKLPEGEIHIITDLCKGCGFCIEFCPRKMLEKSNQLNKRGVYPPKVTDEGKCTLCGFCTAICPDFAIFCVEKKQKADDDYGEK